MFGDENWANKDSHWLSVCKKVELVEQDGGIFWGRLDGRTWLSQEEDVKSLIMSQDDAPFRN